MRRGGLAPEASKDVFMMRVTICLYIIPVMNIKFTIGRGTGARSPCLLKIIFHRRGFTTGEGRAY